jgi:NADH dehydrogenase FAD-containing subunit
MKRSLEESRAMTPNEKAILLVGAGQAHLRVLARARDFVRAGARLTLVSPEPYWFYSNMASEVLSGYYGLSDFRVDLPALTARFGVAFLCDEVVSLLPEHRKVMTIEGRMLDYDLVSFNLGSQANEPEHDVPVDGSFPLTPIRNIIEIRNEIETLLELKPGQPLVVMILGGGPCGVETALNLAALLRERAPAAGWSITLLEAKARLLPELSPRASVLAARRLQQDGVQVRTGAEIQHVQSGRVVLDRGETMNFDLAVMALGNRVADLFIRAGLLTDEVGALLVERTLRLRDHPEIFAAGDCARLWGLGLPRLGVHAAAQGPILANNLLAVLQGRPLKPYNGQAPAPIISLGPRDALWTRGRWAWRGKGVLTYKHWRDRRALRPYQKEQKIESRK